MNQVLWKQLKALVNDRIGFRIRQQDTQDFRHKIEARIKALSLNNLEEYYTLLSSFSSSQDINSQEQYLAQKELKILASAITNGESFFFRDRGQFDLLKNYILPEIIASKCQAKEAGKTSYLSLKVWSAGCSTGEEVYSLAMLISELIPDPAQWQIVIIGTDINQNFLDLARQGIYKKWSFRLTEPLLKEKYFIEDREKWQVKPHIRSMVSFYQDNLVDLDCISHYNYAIDLVLCRNVFIYFDDLSIAKAVTKIARTLNYGGYFISGHAELQSIKMDDFKVVNFAESIVYQYVGNHGQNFNYVIEDREFNEIAVTQKYPQTIKQNELTNSHLSVDNQAINEVSITEASSPTIKQDSDRDLSLSDDPILLSNSSFPTIKQNQNTPALDSLKSKLQDIETLLAKNDYDLVIEEARQLVREQQTEEAYYLMAQAYANQGDLEKAQNHCDLSLQVDSIYIPALFLSAQIAEEKNNYRQAKELLKRIIYLEPLSINAYLDLGEIYRSENDLARSKKIYRAAYNILQETPQNQIINYRGKTNVNSLLTLIKHRL